jgi:hypothetical protein
MSTRQNERHCALNRAFVLNGGYASIDDDVHIGVRRWRRHRRAKQSTLTLMSAQKKKKKSSNRNSLDTSTPLIHILDDDFGVLVALFPSQVRVRTHRLRFLFTQQEKKKKKKQSHFL